jgi:hypothetical protein
MILISCGEVRRELSNYIDDEVTPEVRARIDEHVRFCPGCKAVYDGVRNVLTLLGSGDIIELPRGFSLRVFERLRAVGDERAFPSPRNMSQNLRAKLDQFVHSEVAGRKALTKSRLASPSTALPRAPISSISWKPMRSLSAV